MFPSWSECVRRVLFYMFYDSRGQVDSYVTHKLEALREYCDYIFVVSNSSLTPEGRSALEPVADEVYVRENVGFDVWAYKEAMEAFGRDRLLDYDELILANYTFFAPIHPFADLFAKMDATECEFWGITDHGEFGNPDEGGFHRHIQSHWIAVRRPMFRSREFEQYWDRMPMITSYDDSIAQHEGRFTKYFTDRGFRAAVAFPESNYPTPHPIFDSVVEMLEDGCPIVKRRLFFHDPVYLEHNVILGKRVMDYIDRKTDYPVDLIWENVSRSAEPRTLYTNMSLLNVLSSEPTSDDSAHVKPTKNPRIGVFAHIYYVDMLDDLMSYVDNIPVPYDLIVTTPTQDRADAIAAGLAKYNIENVEIRLVNNQGRDMAAFFVGCRDLLLSDKYDLICRVHTKKSPQDASNASNLFKHHLLDNLLDSPAYVERVLELFEREDKLGMVFPPIINIGYPTMGHSWFYNRERAEELAKKLGIDVPFDQTTPLAPYGSMFWARPEAIRRMAKYDFNYSDYPEEGEYRDGSLSHVQERLLSYCALTDEYHIRCAINQDWAGINYAFLEYKLQLLSSRLPHFTQDQVDYLTYIQAGQPMMALTRMAFNERYPRTASIVGPAYRVARRVAARRRERRTA